MKGYFSKILSFFIFCLFAVPGSVLTAQSSFDCGTAQSLREMLDERHIASEVLEDKWSEAVAQNLIAKLDFRGLFFTRSDFNGALGELDKLEQLVKDDGCGFISRFNAFLKNRITKVDTLLSEITYAHLEEATARTSPLVAKAPLTDDWEGLRARWVAYLKAQTFERKYIESTPEELEATALADLFEEVRTQERCKLSKKLQLLGDTDAFVSKAFFKAISSTYDPHTNFYPYGLLEVLAEFRLDREKSFGMHLTENDQGQIVIGKLFPGGPAWRSNRLHVGDVVTKMLANGKEVDFSCSSLSEVRQKVGDKDTDTAELIVLGGSSEQKSVKLTKEKLTSAENAVRGYILSGQKNIGYISLPDFYTSEGEDDEERGCARDVAREVFKLKRDKIDGLILDLRNNGGGSLQEALELIGIFVDEGPLAIVDRKGKEILMRDRNRGAVYTGPLVVLVNSQSASASELVAATLQDYNRALIVGETTFGKAVGQRMFPVGKFMGESLSDDEKLDDLPPAFVKVTTLRLYRLNGTSYQQLGVQPDVYIPELSENSVESESDDPFSVVRKNVDRDTYFKKYPEFPVSALSARHEERLESSGFLKARELLDSIRNAESQLTDYSVDAYLNLRELKLRKEKVLNALLTNTSAFKSANHSFDQPVIDIDTRKKEVEMMTLRNLENNSYVRAAYFVLADLINATD